MSYPQSTSCIVTLPMYLLSDHITEAGSALSPTVTISKNGAAYANPSAGASTATSVGNNVYKFTLTTTDTNTLGDLWVRFTEATCDPIQRMLVIVKATNGGLTALPDTAVTTNASLLTSGTGTDQIQVSAIATAVWQSLTTTNWGANTFGNFVLISNNSNRSVFVTGAGSGHIASDVHAMQSDVITASALATDAVTEIRSAILTAMYVDGATNKIKVNADNSVNSTGGGGSGGTVTGFSAEALAQLAPTITVVQPLVTINSTTGLPMRIEIVQGADYNSTDGTSISLTMTGTFPAWTGATAYLDIDCGTTLSVTGSITTATGSTRVITFNLTATQTALLTDATETRNEIVSDVGWFDVRVVLASSSRVMKPVSKAVFVARRPA